MNKPRICAKYLFELFKSFYPAEVCGLDTDLVITKIKRINAEISAMSFLRLFGRNSPAQQKIKQFEKAKELGFYLNLNSKMSPENWIEMLSV